MVDVCGQVCQALVDPVLLCEQPVAGTKGLRRPAELIHSFENAEAMPIQQETKAIFLDVVSELVFYKDAQRRLSAECTI